MDCKWYADEGREGGRGLAPLLAAGLQVRQLCTPVQRPASTHLGWHPVRPQGPLLFALERPSIRFLPASPEGVG